MGTVRTLRPLAAGAEPLVRAAWQAWETASHASPALITAELLADGSVFSAPATVRRPKPVDWFGALRIVWAEDGVKVKLHREACAGQVHQPRRSSRHLATLAPSSPVRVLLNGRADWSSGRMYYLQDYLVVLCESGRPPAALGPAQEFDLQANLV